MTAHAEDSDEAGVIILLGNESDDAGLSKVAQARCRKAAELAEKHPTYRILPTGSFGSFNTAHRPHGDFLKEYLKTLNISDERILSYTNSANTVEDAFFARRRIVDLGIHHIIIITSPFHMQRTWCCPNSDTRASELGCGLNWTNRSGQ